MYNGYAPGWGFDEWLANNAQDKSIRFKSAQGKWVLELLAVFVFTVPFQGLGIPVEGSKGSRGLRSLRGLGDG